MTTIRLARDMPDDNSRKVMDKLTNAWEGCGEWFRRRPVAVIFTIMGALIFSGLMGYVIVNQNTNRTDIDEVRSVLCGGKSSYTPEIEKNCRDLLTQLLKNPTTAQAERLRQIVKETP